MKVPGKTFVGAFGFSLTLLSTVLVVAVLSGAPFAASAAMVDGFHAEMGSIEGENFTMSMVMGGIDECQTLVLGEIDQATVRGFGAYRKVELPGGNVSLRVKIPAEANMSMTDVELKMMALNSEWMNATGGAIYENYSAGMRMGRDQEFSVDLRRVEITNATSRIYAISSGSMKIPLSVPQFDVGVNEAPPEQFPMTKCPDHIANGNASGNTPTNASGATAG